MKWLTKVYNPRLPDARYFYTYETDDRVTEWNAYIQWINTKHIGNPKPSDTFTVEQLKQQNMIGIYETNS